MQRIKMSVFVMALIAGQATAGGESDSNPDPDFGFDFVTIGDVDNIPYPGTIYSLLDSINNAGSVGYEYRIARTELTSGQYLEYFNLFLSADPAEFFTLLPGGDSSLFWVAPGVPLRFESGLNMPSMSGVQLDWYQAAMFCNWMHNGQSSDRASLMNGVYDISTFGPIDPDTGNYPDQPKHHPEARYWIPVLDEYVKAVFYAPNKDGAGPGWWNYGHSSNEPAVHGLPGNGEVVRDVPIHELREIFGPAVRLRTVPLGIYTDVQSPWGLLDVLGGNGEWIEDWENSDEGHARRRLVNPSSNEKDAVFDVVWSLWSQAPENHRHGLRIASAVRHPADLDKNWVVDWFDVSRFIELYVAGEMSVDLNADGKLDINDVWAYLAIMG